MKIKIVMSLIALCALAANASAADGDCASETSANVSEKCREELVRSIIQDKVSQAVATALVSSAALTNCKTIKASQLQLQYADGEAVGPALEVSAFVGCDSDSGIDGYILSGDYFINGGYQFKQLTLSTYE